MNKIKKNLDNQAVGLLPLLLFMFLDNYFSYMFSFVIAITFCLFCVFLYGKFRAKHIYQFMLLPTIFTFGAYAVFFLFGLRPMLFVHSPLVVEVFLVVFLALFGFGRHIVLHRIRHSERPAYERLYLRTILNEFFFMAQLAQGLYTLHLFSILLYSVMPSELHRNPFAERMLYRELPWLIGMLVILYDQIRVSWVRGSLAKEMWLPVVNDEGKVIGCMARSVSRILPKKYCHPVIRVAVIHEGMLYLGKRPSDDFVAPDRLDHPMHSYMLFRRSHKETLRALLGALAQDPSVEPRCLIRYTFETSRVKHLVFLYIVRLHSARQLETFSLKDGKLWTAKQIAENMGRSVFSGYFEKEFPYLQNTVLFADHYREISPAGHQKGSGPTGG